MSCSLRCQQLENQKLCYEHDRRAAQHRIELEQQILAQCMEQKERQMRHLIETNQRAEALFARNAELEALLYTLQTERESRKLQYKMKLIDCISVNLPHYLICFPVFISYALFRPLFCFCT